MCICGTFQCICVSSDRTELLEFSATNQRHPAVNSVHYIDGNVNRDVIAYLLASFYLSVFTINTNIISTSTFQNRRGTGGGSIIELHVVSFRWIIN